MLASRVLLGVVAVGWLSCGKSATEPAHAPASSAQATDPLAELSAFDAKGKKTACDLPRSDCPERSVDADFNDQCRRRGFRVVRCGCEDRCSGRVTTAEKHYDSTGKLRSCAPEAAGCSPPETSAAFQDSCTDGGNELVVCGCEWLCNGPLRSGVAAESP